jgi:hypothetical protein
MEAYLNEKRFLFLVKKIKEKYLQYTYKEWFQIYTYIEDFVECAQLTQTTNDLCFHLTNYLYNHEVFPRFIYDLTYVKYAYVNVHEHIICSESQYLFSTNTQLSPMEIIGKDYRQIFKYTKASFRLSTELINTKELYDADHHVMDTVCSFQINQVYLLE